MNRIIYDFCLHCGGLVKNGVCMSCGQEKTYDAPKEDFSAKESELPEEMPLRTQAGAERANEPEKKKRTALITGIGIGAIVLIALLAMAISHGVWA